jgi:hypothetical protein
VNEQLIPLVPMIALEGNRQCAMNGDHPVLNSRTTVLLQATLDYAANPFWRTWLSVWLQNNAMNTGYVPGMVPSMVEVAVYSHN